MTVAKDGIDKGCTQVGGIQTNLVVGCWFFSSRLDGWSRTRRIAAVPTKLRAANTSAAAWVDEEI